MALFNKLPGFIKSPPGRERLVLRAMGKILPAGLALLLTPSLLLRLVERVGAEPGFVLMLEQLEIFALGLVLVFCNAVVAVTVGAFIIMVMKGPAYVADAYPLPDADRPRRNCE